MLAHIKEILEKAKKENYAIGAFNTSNLEVTLGIVQGAVVKNSPVIVQISETSIKYAGLKPITHIVETIAKNEAVKIPIALHLDHGRNFHSVVECINAGFSSVHIDASELPFDENIALTKKIVDYAHQHNVWAQGELGIILGQEGLIKKKEKKIKKENYMTDPDMVKEYVKKTGIDTLAISVGSMHGMFEGEEHLDFARIKKIREQTSLPLVLHGASGVDDDEIKKGIKDGLTVINIDTKLRQEFTNALRKKMNADTGEIDPRKILAPAIKAVQKTVEERIEVFGSANKS